MDKWEQISQKAYYDAFSKSTAESPLPGVPSPKAHDIALDIRKFEIDLYWKRATYFWTLIGAIFVAHFAILNSDKIDDKSFYAYVTACLGFVFTFAWFLANRGSKYWLENWENHVDMLEFKSVGHLYKIVLERNEDPNIIDKLFTSPMPISVSKINQWIGVFTLLVWLLLGVKSLPPFDKNASVSIMRILVTIFTIGAIFVIFKFSRSYQDNQNHKAFKRKSTIVDPPQAT